MTIHFCAQSAVKVDSKLENILSVIVQNLLCYIPLTMRIINSGFTIPAVILTSKLVDSITIQRINELTGCLTVLLIIFITLGSGPNF